MADRARQADRAEQAGPTGQGPLAECAALVAKSDPEGFAAAMSAPLAARAVLLPLYAFNAEVARAPYVTQEFLIAEMRLQWWRDALDGIAKGAPTDGGDVVAALSDALDAPGAAVLDDVIEARRRDIAKEPFATPEALMTHLDQGRGSLTWAAARALGATGAEAEACARALGRAWGLAGWLRAAPALERMGWQPWPETGAERLIAMGLADLAAARAGRRHIPRRAAPALRGGYLTGPILHRAAKGQDLAVNPAVASARLLWRSLTGSW